MKFVFNKKFAALSIALFAVEAFIALFVHDRIVRPFVGDMLVVILLFSACRSVVETNYFGLALGVLIFAFSVEIGQYFHLISILGLQRVKLARIVLGTTFDFNDLFAYSSGFLLICLIGAAGKKKQPTSKKSPQ